MLHKKRALEHGGGYISALILSCGILLLSVNDVFSGNLRKLIQAVCTMGGQETKFDFFKPIMLH